jgi:hypothetical protein
MFALLLLTNEASADEGGSHPRKLRRFWIGFTFGFNAVVHPSGTDVCLGKTSGWICWTSDFGRYPDQTYPPRLPFPGQAGRVSGGLALGGVQAMVNTLDFALTDGFLLGVRFGWYFRRANVNASEWSGLPFMAEVRATWVFGSHPISEGGIRPYVLLGAGVADFSIPVSTTAVDSAGSHPVDAWKVAGPGFVTTGVGIRFGTPKLALMLAPLKMTLPFGAGSLGTWMPELSVQSAPFQ